MKMQENLNRRELLKWSALTAGAMAFAPLLDLRAADEAAASGPRKKVLFFTKSSGFQHSVITRPKEDPSKLAYAEQILTDLGAKNGFDVVCSKDGSVFAPESLKQFDGFVFYTTGDLTKDSDKYAQVKGLDGKMTDDKSKFLHKEPGMPPGGKEAFLDAIKAGKGFVGFHSASDTFHSAGHVKGKADLLRDVNEKGEDEFDPYIRMLGGEFIVHGKQQESTLKCVDPNFPAAKAFADARFLEEWYSLKNFAPDLHVILAQDCTNMVGPMYQRKLFPETWARMHGQGRVFYTSMGHREDVWQKPEYLNLIVAALNWTTGRVDADVTPNIKQVTPDAEVKKPAAT
jgi:type 1 glutamine amidotransferase